MEIRKREYSFIYKGGTYATVRTDCKDIAVFGTLSTDRKDGLKKARKAAKERWAILHIEA